MKKLYFLLFCLISFASFGQMTTVLQESFETVGNGTRYTTQVPEFSDGFGDYFTRTDGSNITTSYLVSGGDGTFFFSAQDTDGDAQPAILTMTFTGINIATYTNLTFAILAAEDDASDGNKDWDADTNVFVEVNIDGAGYVKVLQFSGGGATNTASGLDANFDGTADGTLLTSTFQEFTASVTGSGSLADIRITFTNLNAGDEDIALDNIRLVNNFAASPSVLVTPGTLSGLKYIVGSGPSAEQSFTVSGSDLTADINVTAPTNFEISSSTGTGFGASLSLRHTAGVITSTTIYTRLKAGLALNSSYTGDIIISTTGTTNKTVALSGGVYVALTNAMVITGVFDPTVTTPRGVELFVIKNIPDLSIFGVESANNGGGVSGQEFTFPAVAATAGQYIYIVGTSQEPDFATFFGAGFTADYASGAMFINGNDAIVLYENTFELDVFGEPTVDGLGSAWDYTDGWAYRNSNTGPSATFTLTDWQLGNAAELDGTINSGSSTAFPIKTYTNVLGISKQQLLDGFALYPNPLRGGLLNIQSPSNTVKNINIFDVIGQQVYHRNTTKNQINISNLNAGMYFVKVQQDGKIATRKLVVE